jgi:hypothetical protein
MALCRRAATHGGSTAAATGGLTGTCALRRRCPLVRRSKICFELREGFEESPEAVVGVRRELEDARVEFEYLVALSVLVSVPAVAASVRFAEALVAAVGDRDRARVREDFVRGVVRLFVSEAVLASESEAEVGEQGFDLL